MAQADLPAHFPCWCRATYSWGGETKKDLGFIEGDLIEALNAGDGQWWVGRLRRDPRAIGSFPSNFVKVLDESFQPAPNSRAGSPRDTPPRQISPTKQKSVFRKPFQAYEVVGRENSLEKEREGTPDSDKEKLKREKSKFRPYASMKTAKAPTGSPAKTASTSPGKPTQPEFRLPDLPQRGSQRTMVRSRSPQPISRTSSQQEQHHSRASSYDHRPEDYQQYQPYRHGPSPLHSRQPSIIDRPPSPLPSTYHDGSAYPQLMRSPSPKPAQQIRSPSPNPAQQPHYSRAPSPQPFEHDMQSSPPPPPPAHRVIFQRSRPASPEQDYDDYHHTPIQPSPGGSHMTPSPLRDAMNDVMSSLHDMTMTSSPAPTARNVWSPDEFELVRSQSKEKRMSQHHSQYSHDFGMPPSRNTSQHVVLDRHNSDQGPIVPLKGSQYSRSRPQTSSSTSSQSSYTRDQALRSRQSAFELGSNRLARTYTTKTNFTNSTDASQNSSSTQATSRSIMSGYSAGGFSATSAGSLARRKFGLGSLKGHRPISLFDTKSSGNLRSDALASESSGSGPSYHESRSSHQQDNQWREQPADAGVFGGLNTPHHKRSGFFRKMIESAKTTAKTGAASARATVSSASRPVSRSGSISPTKSLFGGSNKEPTGFGNGIASRPASSTGNASRDMGLGNGNEWMQVRRDINRSNSLSRKEQEERHERAQMLDLMPFRPIDTFLEQLEGDESIDGFAVIEPTDFNTASLALVDKSTRFINSVPPMVSAAALAQNYICRPHRSDVQKLRAIFTWVAERITWEEDFEGQPDARRVIQSRRGCSREIAVLIHDMCSAVGLHAEVVRGYLKTPGETPDPDSIARGNHHWNAVLVDGEWRVMDAALASPSHPRRHDFSGASSQVAENWYFLARPSEICYTHISLLPEQQHIVPAIQHEILAGLPCATPSYFRHGLELCEYDSSVLHLEGLEMAHLHVFVPEDVECVAECESRTFARDMDGDLFESGDIITKAALSQPEWVAGRKRFTIKSLLPQDANTGTLKIYAGKRGLMHSIKDNPHSLAFSLPLTHNGQNPPYDFFLRHPTPHAQRHDLYVMQPQCAKLCMNNTFVFAVRQHPSALSRFTPDTWGSMSVTAGGIRPTSPGPGVPYARPSSAMSMMSTTTSIVGGSQYSDSSSNASGMTGSQLKPAKLAIQTPSQKIIRLTKKEFGRGQENDADGLVSTWETVVKISERGTWRGLVLADRSARWCVFAEWQCV